MSRLPRVFFFRYELSLFSLPVWTALVPKVNKKLVLRTIKGAELGDEMTHNIGGNRESEHPVTQSQNLKISCNATKRSLQNQANRESRKTQRPKETTKKKEWREPLGQETERPKERQIWS